MNCTGYLLAIGIGIYALGIIALLLLPEKKKYLSLFVSGSLGSIVLFICGANALLSPQTFHVSLCNFSYTGALTLTVDKLSAFFLLVSALVSFPASIYAAHHVTSEHRDKTGTYVFLYLALLMAIPLVLVAADAFLFIVSWEIMSIFIYLLVVGGGDKERPGYTMLAVGEAGTLAILVAFLLLSGNSGVLGFNALKLTGQSLGTGMCWVIFILSFLGFGIKAGLTPLNFWLSRTYTSAPSSFLPLMAGATLNLGLYGIIRVNAVILPMHSAGQGIVLLMAGTVTALIGILYATIEDDLKTVLAHSSIENAGIITTGLGAGFIFVATNHQIAAAMAFTAALYHLLNHSVFKTLLFMATGAAEEKAGTRSLNRLGGLLKQMPLTGLFFLIGALSISAMPPFNGFVSEWLTLQSLLRSVELASTGLKIAFVIAGTGIALTAGLAVTCFVRAFAMGFLGKPRSEKIKNAGEVKKSVLASMAFLAVTCLVLGVLPTYMIPTVDQVVEPITGAASAGAIVPPFFNNPSATGQLPAKFVKDFHDIGAQVGQHTMPGRGLSVILRGQEKNPVVFVMSSSYMLVMLLFLLGITILVVWLVAARRRKIKIRPAWDGGIKHFSPKMTYTATGFAQPVKVIFDSILRPRREERLETVATHFRVSIQHSNTQEHLIDWLVYQPAARSVQLIANKLAYMHDGRINSYAFYALLILIIFLLISS